MPVYTANGEGALVNLDVSSYAAHVFIDAASDSDDYAKKKNEIEHKMKRMRSWCSHKVKDSRWCIQVGQSAILDDFRYMIVASFDNANDAMMFKLMI